MSDFDFEPVRGLPELPPAGEHVLWQGAPNWRRLAREIYHVDKVALYFAALICWRGISERGGGASFEDALRATAASALWLVPLGLVAIGILMLLAYLTERTTVYTITNRRVVIRFGIALPMTINFPFRTIGAAGLNVRADGSGDIPLSIDG